MEAEDYRKSVETSYLVDWDSNNLYGCAMSERLPIGDFRFLTPEEVEKFDMRLVADDAPKGYIVECNLHYPPELHDVHNDCPLTPEHLTIRRDMLNDYALSLGENTPRPSKKKIILSLFDKTQYVTHYRNLKFYLENGLKLIKIHRVLEFTQTAWLKPYICTPLYVVASEGCHDVCGPLP